MRRRDQWIEWILAVERESETAGYALELLREQLRREPSSLKERGLDHRDYVELARNRDATYLIRLFDEFENGLREAWARAWGETTHPRTADLLHAFAARCRMSNDRLVETHRVRVYRNGIVHDESELATPTTLGEARRFLCRFFSLLPPDW